MEKCSCELEMVLSDLLYFRIPGPGSSLDKVALGVCTRRIEWLLLYVLVR